MTRKVGPRLAITCTLVLGMSGLVQTAAAAGAREPACPPPGGGTCYFEWYDAGGSRSLEIDPQIGVCRNMTGGAVRGTNRTNRTVHLWTTANCSGSASALVASARSWNDPSVTYHSFRPIR